jgi:1,4-alpha-glucan branching enzyme
MTKGLRARSAGDRGALAIVLHTHMPYVEGFGTWPFGEEWLWEAMASCYVPLLELLDSGAPLTLSVTPVLADQLEVADLASRFYAFVGDVRSFTHSEDARGLRQSGRDVLARELERSAGDYERAVEVLAARGDDLLGALAPHARWTSSATHAILPLVGSDALVRAQVQTGIDAQRARFGAGWGGGFWLPECAHAPYLEPLLAGAGVRRTCVELTERFGLGDRAHLRPLIGEAGVVLVPIDRATIDVVWGRSGYPSDGRYRDYHRRTVHNHCPWSIDGSAYDHERAQAVAHTHAAEFVARTIARLRDDGQGLPGGGLVVCAFDTELFGHWWYEGITWLQAVVAECSRQGLALVGLDDALQACEPEPLEAGAEPWEPSSWGEHGDLSTWSGFVARRRAPAASHGAPASDGAAEDARMTVADMAFATRAAELSLLRAGHGAGTAALRALLALQSSDWAFMIARKLAASYAQERFAGHREMLLGALQAGPDAGASGLRNIAPGAAIASLAEA